MVTLHLAPGPDAERRTRSVLALDLDGWDAVWALRRHFEVPLDHVVAARAASRHEVPTAGLRMGGAELPGRIRAGRYWWPRSGWSFWFVRRADEVLLVDLRDERYERLVVEVDDPERTAAEVREALARRSESIAQQPAGVRRMASRRRRDQG